MASTKTCCLFSNSPIARNHLTFSFVFAFVFVNPYAGKASSVCCFGVSGVRAMSLYIECGVMQRVCH